MQLTKDNILHKHPLYCAKEAEWQKIDDLQSTAAMRAAGNTYAPQGKEDGKAFAERLSLTHLYPGVRRAITRCISKPFSRAVEVTDVIESLDYLEYYADREGRNLTQFMREFAKYSLRHGRCHILVDYPPQVKAEDGTGAKLTKADEDKLLLRPYFAIITAPALYDWETEIVGSEIRFTAIKFMTNESVAGVDGTESRRTMYKYEPTTIEKWQEINKQWQKVDETANTLGKIALVTYCTDPDGFMQSDLPFMDLADMNVTHWQRSSDYHMKMHYDSFTMLSAIGLTPDEYKNGFVVGANKALLSINPTASFSYVEAAGTAASTLKACLSDLEEQMEIMGVQPLIRRSAASTATGQQSSWDGIMSDIEAWVRGWEDTCEMAYEYAAMWVKTELPESFDVNIYSDFAIGLQGADAFEALAEMRRNGDLTPETFLQEAQRLGKLSEAVDVLAEASKAKEAKDESANAFAEAMKKSRVANMEEDGNGASNLERGA